jgi:hypothetical protein
MVERIQDGDEKSPMLDEAAAWLDPDGEVVMLAPMQSPRDFPKGTRIEVKNRYRGKYVGNGILIADSRFITSADPAHFMETMWVSCSWYRVRIEPHWIVVKV